MSWNMPAGVTENDDYFTDESGDVCEHSSPICAACEKEDYMAKTAERFGVCDKCGEVAMSMSDDGKGNVKRLCDKHSTEDVKRANLRTYNAQHITRESLREKEHGIPLVLMVSEDKNLEGAYYARVENPINGCSVGFGSTPSRALRALALHLADEADIVLQRIKEQEFERRQLEKELDDA
jgi:hypothetical protein